jgi:transposase
LERRKFSREFRVEALKLFRERGCRLPKLVEIDRLSNKVVQLKAERDIPKKAAVGSTGQRNMIYFMRHTEAHNGKDRTTRFIAAK